jgi:hypothetical protein
MLDEDFIRFVAGPWHDQYRLVPEIAEKVYVPAGGSRDHVYERETVKGVDVMVYVGMIVPA